MTITGVNYIGSEESRNGKDTFQAPDPANNTTLPEPFYIATEKEVDRAMESANNAFPAYRDLSGKRKAEFLEAIAQEILSLGPTLLNRASAETGYPTGRIEGERGRTVHQLRLFAELLCEGSWVDARIDTADPGREPAPKPDIRNMLVPIGPVVVFGASNFPLAFSTAGGDTASALAAGCPVVVKAHESHPGTNELVARAILKAAEKTKMPNGIFSSLNGMGETGQALVRHPMTRAIGFTGSTHVGTAIYRSAAAREHPIPVYAEMGSVNPIFLLPEKLKSDSSSLAAECAASVTLTFGQFCTNPGLIFAIEGDSLPPFLDHLAGKLHQSETMCMLNPGIAGNYRENRDRVFSQKGVDVLVEPGQEEGTYSSAALAVTTSKQFLENPVLHEEVFGPFTLVVKCSGEAELAAAAEKLNGQLAISLMGTESELSRFDELIKVLREKAGRVIFNDVPTGVEVCHSMMHGGPFPSTSDSKFTSVGTSAIRRFVRPVAFQNCPDALLPDELKEKNPLGIWRLVDGEQSREAGSDL
ncbi:MAG: aldehyde dehydrogenase (NADP(+)) [Balneolaceae bacterium]